MRLRYVYRIAAFLALATLSMNVCADDAKIAKQLSEQLKLAQDSGELEGFHLGVKVEDGTVWIKGRVANIAQRSLALDRARRISGVRLVVNDISVGESAAAAQLATQEPMTVARTALAENSIEQAQHFAQAGRPTAVGTSTLGPASRPPVPVSGRVQRGPAMPAHRSEPVPVRAYHRPVDYSEVVDGYGGNPIGSSGGYADDGYAGEYGDSGYPAPSPTPMAGNGPDGGGVSYEQPQMPGYAWPSYAAHPNYAGVSYPKQYSPMAWPYIGPFYPYPQVPLGWRKVCLEWDDGWWMLDFKSK